VNNGFNGSEAEWLASLQAPNGACPAAADGSGLACGTGARALSENSIAIGPNALAASSVAVGANAQATGTNTTAVGDGAVASGDFSAAYGNGAQATADNSVALGNGSVADEANTVAVGSAGNERRITDVAAGVNGTDAVNLNQLLTGQAETLEAARTYTDQQVGALRTDFQNFQGSVDQRFEEQDRRVNAVGALSAAMALSAPDPRVKGDTLLSMGVGHYRNQQALGGTLAHRLSDRAAVRIGGAIAPAGESTVGAGITVGW
jgi:autotransporter adhesin